MHVIIGKPGGGLIVSLVHALPMHQILLVFNLTFRTCSCPYEFNHNIGQVILYL